MFNPRAGEYFHSADEDSRCRRRLPRRGCSARLESMDRRRLSSFVRFVGFLASEITGGFQIVGFQIPSLARLRPVDWLATASVGRKG
jgi:hypothetical protein